MLLASSLTLLALACPQEPDVRERVQALVEQLGDVDEAEFLRALGPPPTPDELLSPSEGTGPLLDLSLHTAKVGEAAARAKAVRESELRSDPALALEELAEAATILEEALGPSIRGPWRTRSSDDARGPPSTR